MDVRESPRLESPAAHRVPRRRAPAAVRLHGAPFSRGVQAGAHGGRRVVSRAAVEDLAPSLRAPRRTAGGRRHLFVQPGCDSGERLPREQRSAGRPVRPRRLLLHRRKGQLRLGGRGAGRGGQRQADSAGAGSGLPRQCPALARRRALRRWIVGWRHPVHSRPAPGRARPSTATPSPTTRISTTGASRSSFARSGRTPSGPAWPLNCRRCSSPPAGTWSWPPSWRLCAWSRWRRPLSTYQLAAGGLAAFLFLAPGFGVQYTAILGPVLVAASLGWGLWYARVGRCLHRIGLLPLLDAPGAARLAVHHRVSVSVSVDRACRLGWTGGVRAHSSRFRFRFTVRDPSARSPEP